MYSYATYVVLSLLAVFVILKRRAAASSSSLQPLKVRVIPPKSLPTVAPRPAKKPLPAPRPCLSPIVVRAQQSFKQLSLDDAVSDMDLLMSSFGSLSMKPGLPRPCLKRGPRAPHNRRVHFRTLPSQPDFVLSELYVHGIPPEHSLDWPAEPQSCAPHVLGERHIYFHSDGRIDFAKGLGTCKSPNSPKPQRPRCKLLRKKPSLSSCPICLRRQSERNTWHLDPALNAPLFTRPPTPRTSTKLPYFT